MLISKTTKTTWNQATRKYYESKGYVYTKYYEEFEVKVEDLSDSSKVLVDVQCDACGEILIGVIWANYKKSIKSNGKYYCHDCSTKLFGGEKSRKSRLKNGKSFCDWYGENLSKEIAKDILSRWDGKLNIDKNGKILTPNDVGHSSRGLNGKGYWFKCLDHPDEHESELKNISSFTNDCSGVNLQCIQCNSISMTHPHLVKYLVNPEDAYKYSAGSSKIKLSMKCPDCGFEKKREVIQLIKNGFACSKCGDGVSYPEKFFFSFLEQLLGIYFKTQLSKTTFKWCGKYRYDFYIIEINGICETGGLQHYEEVKGHHWQSLKDIQKNDKNKEDLARENGIDNYIILDCRKSELKWIKDSIMNSEPSLPKLLNFTEEDIDWLKCHEYACSNIVKLVCNMWKDGVNNISEISKHTKIGKRAIRKYLKQGTELGWCDYDPEKELRKNIKALQEKLRIKVICLTTREIFDSQKEAKLKYNIQGSSISQCCYGKLKTCGKDPTTKESLQWMFYDEYIIKNKTVGWYEEYMNSHNYSSKIICLTTGEIFNSQTEASKKYNIRRQNISKCCNNKLQSVGEHPITKEPLQWMFYNTYINTIELKGAIK